MKKYAIKTLWVLFGVSLLITHQGFAQGLSGDSWANARETGKASITALYLEEEAFAFLDNNGKLTGVEGDIFAHFINWVKNAKGIELEINYVEETSFVKFYDMIKNSSGGVFGLGSTTILDRRRSEVQFTPPFINNIAVLTSHEDAPDLNSLDEIASKFSGMKAVVADGTTLLGYMQELKEAYFKSLEIEILPSQIAVAEKVASDPNYFAYVDLSIYWPAVSKQNKPIKRQAVGDLSAEQFGFILPLDSDWEPVIKEFFSLGAGYRSSNAYRAVLMKHLGSEVTKMLELAAQKHK